MLDFINDDVFSADCDVIIVPISTMGTISNSFMNGLKRNNIKPRVLDKKQKLGQITFQEISNHSTIKYIGFACTVDNHKSSYLAIRTIGHLLGLETIGLNKIKTIATPILGTGAGGLDHFKSRNILYASFYESADPSLVLNFYTPDSEVYANFSGRAFDVDTPSCQLVIHAQLDQILENKLIKTITNDKTFYYELAQQKFYEFLAFDSNNKIFYSNLRKEFRSSKLTFSQFLPTVQDSKDKSKFLMLCGELIAYIDFNAYSKNIWNQCSDKRILARSGVNQT